MNYLERCAANRETHTIKIMPFKWLEAFKIVDPVQIESIRRRIICLIRDEEARLASSRAPAQKMEGFVVTDEYLPRKKERKIFMYGSTREIRLEFLSLFDTIHQSVQEML